MELNAEGRQRRDQHTVLQGTGCVWGWWSGPRLWCRDTTPRGTSTKVSWSHMREQDCMCSHFPAPLHAEHACLRMCSHPPTPAGSTPPRGTGSQGSPHSRKSGRTTRATADASCLVPSTGLPRAAGSALVWRQSCAPKPAKSPLRSAEPESPHRGRAAPSRCCPDTCPTATWGRGEAAVPALTQGTYSPLPVGNMRLPGVPCLRPPPPPRLGFLLGPEPGVPSRSAGHARLPGCACVPLPVREHGC